MANRKKINICCLNICALVFVVKLCIFSTSGHKNKRTNSIAKNFVAKHFLADDNIQNVCIRLDQSQKYFFLSKKISTKICPAAVEVCLFCIIVPAFGRLVVAPLQSIKLFNICCGIITKKESERINTGVHTMPYPNTANHHTTTIDSPFYRQFVVKPCIERFKG